MSPSIASAAVTTSDLFTLSEDGVERDLIRGELREYPMTKRNRHHSRVMFAVGLVLGNWVIQSGSGGEVTGGEAGVRLKRDPDTTVGLDVGYFSAKSLTEMPSNQAWYEGAPVLAVEVLSPSDTHEGVVEKINLYLECGVAVVWVLDPDFQTLTIYRPKQSPLLIGAHETLDGSPELPGLKVSVSAFFG